jgi:hypothetical protein
VRGGNMDRTTVNLDNLAEMREKYPNRRIIFRVDSDVVAEDGYNYWYATECRTSLDSILDGSKEMPYDIQLDKEKWYSKDYNDDELVDALYESERVRCDADVTELHKMLPWEHVIVVHISL